MSQYSNVEYAQTEYQQCYPVKYQNDNNFYNGRRDNYANNYDNYYDNNYDNIYNNNYDNYNNNNHNNHNNNHNNHNNNHNNNYDNGYNNSYNNNYDNNYNNNYDSNYDNNYDNNYNNDHNNNHNNNNNNNNYDNNYNNNYNNNFDNNHNNNYDNKNNNYENYNINYYDQRSRQVNNTSLPNQYIGKPKHNSLPVSMIRQGKRPVSITQTVMGQVTPRPSPQTRPVSLIVQSPVSRPVNGRNVPARNKANVPPPQRPVARQINNQSRASPSMRATPIARGSPSTRPLSLTFPASNIPPRPGPGLTHRSVSSPQLRPRNTSAAGLNQLESSGGGNGLKLPLRNQSSQNNMQKSKARQSVLIHSNLSTSTTFDNDTFEPSIPPRNRQHRVTSISSQGSAGGDRRSTGDHNIASKRFSRYSDQDVNSLYNNTQNSNVKNLGYFEPPYEQNYSYPQENNPQAPAPVPAPTPQNVMYYNPASSTPVQGPQGPQNTNNNSNKPLNFHPQAMHNGIGNQYRPPPQPKPQPPSYSSGGKVPMTSLGGQPMPYGQSLELYRQNAKKSNDPHVQLEFAKYLIAMADGKFIYVLIKL